MQLARRIRKWKAWETHWRWMLSDWTHHKTYIITRKKAKSLDLSFCVEWKYSIHLNFRTCILNKWVLVNIEVGGPIVLYSCHPLLGEQSLGSAHWLILKFSCCQEGISKLWGLAGNRKGEQHNGGRGAVADYVADQQARRPESRPWLIVL